MGSSSMGRKSPGAGSHGAHHQVTQWHQVGTKQSKGGWVEANNNYKSGGVDYYCLAPTATPSGFSDTESTVSASSAASAASSNANSVICRLGWSHRLVFLALGNIRSLLFFTCVAVYANSLGGDFVFDDVTAIRDNKV